MSAAWKALLFLLFTAAGASWAGEMRTWTIWGNQRIEAKTVAFEKRSLKFSRGPHAVLVNGIAYNRLKPQLRKVVDLVVEQHGFDGVAALLASKATPLKELKYLSVIFRTKDDDTLNVPLDALAGSQDGTGDYKLAYDEALAWFKAHEEQPQAPPPVAESDPDAAARLEAERRRLDQERQRLEDARRQWEQDSRSHDEQARRDWEEQMRQKDAEYRRREAEWKRAQGEHEKWEQDQRARTAAERRQRADVEKKRREEDQQRRQAERKHAEDDAKRSADAAAAKQAANAAAAKQAADAAAAAKKRDEEQKRAEAERKRNDEDRKREEERKKREEDEKKKDAGKKK
jgi:hypothetical protein